jgi:predicted glycoside hydrolase/deacetylase ChbG (UPF0249 family)
VKKLIVTADDFGYSSQVNAAVAAAYQSGILRYASLMVDRPAAAEAARLAKANPGLGVGLHLELCADSPEIWGARYFFSPSDRARIRPEIERQLDALRDLGVTPTHVDGHFNIHVHPVIFPILSRLAMDRGIPRLRLPGGELASCRGFGAGPGAFVNAVVFGLLKAWLYRRRGKIHVPERTWGLLRSGLMTEDYLVHLLENLPEGETEVYFHPTTDPASRVTDRPTPTHHTVSELEALLSPRVKRALEASGATLAGLSIAG